MTKTEFMIEYVLNRAIGSSGGLRGYRAVEEAETAWERIMEITGGNLSNE